MKTRTLSIIFFVLSGLLVFSFFSYKIGYFSGQQNILKTPPAYILSQSQKTPGNVDFSVFWEVWRQAENKFLEKGKINYQKMVYGAINGMLESLGDPYTSFFNPDEAKSFEDELSGKYEGVGMYVGVKDSQIMVISPLKNSPAEKAGIKPGDKIIKIEDVMATNITVEEAVKLIKGPENTSVVILIEREGAQEPKEFTIKRQVIEIPTLEWEMLDNEIALVKIYQFNQILTDEFSKTALTIEKNGTKKIIVDVRNNPGGYLEVAQNVAGWFIKEGKTVVIQESNKPEEKQIYKSKGPGSLGKMPVVVLINEGSASASEILAGALKDQINAKLVGIKSFGKGSVQEQVFLSDSSSLKVTVAKWLTPSGKSIDKQGLEPDVKVEVKEPETPISEDKSKDTQLQKAIEIIKMIR